MFRHFHTPLAKSEREMPRTRHKVLRADPRSTGRGALAGLVNIALVISPHSRLGMIQRAEISS